MSGEFRDDEQEEDEEFDEPKESCDLTEYVEFQYRNGLVEFYMGRIHSVR